MTAIELNARVVPAQGDPSGPPVLLMHGFASTAAADWPDDEWVAPLARAGREVILVDLPGHGASPALAAPLPSTDAVAAVAAVARGTGGPLDIVAYSLGARLAWDLPARPGIAVRRLVLGGLSHVEPFGAVDVLAARAALAGGPQPADPLTGKILAIASTPENDPASLLQFVEGLAADPFDPAASPPAVPVLLAGGTEDPMAQGLEALAAAAPDARVQRVPGDHLGALHSRAFRDAAITFLTG